MLLALHTQTHTHTHTMQQHVLTAWLQSPEHGATVTVANQTKVYKRGDCLIFDDSFVHDVTNDSDEIRTVLKDRRLPNPRPT